jgi:hypothetical protein
MLVRTRQARRFTSICQLHDERHCVLADLPIVCLLADLPVACLLADLSAGGHSIALGTGLATQGCLLSAEVLASLYF